MYEDFTIKQFINAWFKNDRTVMTEEVFDTVKNEYIDTSGQYHAQEFSKKCYIQYIGNRINSINIWCDLQLRFLDTFNIPAIPYINFLEKFGHKIYWNEDKEGFITQIEKVKKKEGKYETILEASIKELEKIQEVREKNSKNEKPQTRGDFISMIISLGKCGYDISQDTTTVEELAYMIKKQLKEQEQYENKK